MVGVTLPWTDAVLEATWNSTLRTPRVTVTHNKTCPYPDDRSVPCTCKRSRVAVHTPTTEPAEVR